MENLVKNYFEIFSNKDIQGLENLFSDDVILQDWDILAKGKKQVLDANKNIFEPNIKSNIKQKNISRKNITNASSFEIF